MPYLEAFAAEGQCGGVLRRGTDIASMRARGFLAATRAKGVCGAIIFVDVRAAFDSVDRNLVFQSDMCQPVIEAAGVPPPLRRLLTSLHEHTWFCMKGIEDLCHFDQGSKQGDPTGDLIYNF